MTYNHLPNLSEYDPRETSEGTIDPLGLYPIADALGSLLAPGVRERQSHPRFLTAIAAGLVVTSKFPDGQISKDDVSEPWQVFEWYIVEGLVRASESSVDLLGVPGRGKVENTIKDKVPLSAKRYLKTPGVFGFHGVYRALAKELGLERGGQLSEFGASLLAAWQEEQGLVGFYLGNQGRGRSFVDELVSAVSDGLKEGATARSASWGNWKVIRNHFSPYSCGKKEARIIAEALMADQADFRRQIINFMTSVEGQGVWKRDGSERGLHEALKGKASKSLKQLIDAINVYEEFSRLLQDAFDDCLVEMTLKKARTSVAELATLSGVKKAHRNVAKVFARASDKLAPFLLAAQFEQLFGVFSVQDSIVNWVEVLFAHHKTVQVNKPPNGKLAWCEKVDQSSFIIRPNYRREVRPQFDDSYVHRYRGASLWSFAKDLRLVRE